MIITDTVSSPVISNITAAPSRFKIKASAKAFKILSGFYSEPILAIPRELGANAWDSHVKAGNTNQMFEVHAPNMLEPWFSVRDFGTGLSPEAIDTIYTTYFESTKTGDNDSDGCMGLGSKTPFNYTENFNVTSFYNGKKYVYNCFIDESGAPNIMQVASVDTNEPNGVEVKFGVKIADIGMWTDKILRAYEPFRYRPTIKGANITYPERKYIFSGKNWGLREPSQMHSSTSHAFMGNYCYPISSNAITRNGNTDKINNMLYYGAFDLYFDIGELEVAPNKEQLQYDDTNNKTANAITAALKNAYIELENLVRKSIETPKTRWEAMGLFHKYNSYQSAFARITNIIGTIPVYFNDKKIHSSHMNLHELSKEIAGINLGSDFVLYVINNNKIKKTNTFHSAGLSQDTVVYYTNNDSIKKTRARYHLDNNYMTNKDSKTQKPMVYILVDKSDEFKFVNNLKEYFGWSNVFNIESLPKPPPAPRQKKTASTDEILAADLSGLISYFSNVANGKYGSASIPSFKREASTFDSNTVYYYFDFLYNDPMWNDKSMREYAPTVIKLFVQNNLQGNATKIYGINKKNSHLLKVGTWINVFDLVKSKVIEAKKQSFEQDLYMVAEYNKYSDYNVLYHALTNNPSFIVNINSASTKKIFTDFMKSFSETVKKQREVDKDVLYMYGIAPKCHTSLTCDINNFTNTLKVKYLNVLHFMRGYSEDSKTVTDIINFIDEKS